MNELFDVKKIATCVVKFHIVTLITFSPPASLETQRSQSSPDHVDLLVHAGLSELIEKNYHLALSYFDKAIELGKRHIDIEIANNPEQYVKRDNLEKRATDKECRLADECTDRDTKKCKDCEENPENKAPNLYSYLEFRPFFRALTNKAVTLQKMKRYQEAIEKYLADLATQESEVWEEVDTLIETKRQSDYDESVKLLVDLRDVGRKKGKVDLFEERLQDLCRQHRKKAGFIRRIKKSRTGGW